MIGVTVLFTATASFAGREFNSLDYVYYRNSIIQDLWMGNTPNPNTVIYFLDQISFMDPVGTDPAGANYENISRVELLDQYCKILKMSYQSQVTPEDNDKRAGSIDAFIDQLKNTPGPYSFNSAIIAKALHIISKGTIICL